MTARHKQIFRQLKRTPLNLLFGSWRGSRPLEDGYTVLLPSPMDMPFMLRLGLEGLKQIDTSNCRQILVVPDGLGDDGGNGLRDVAAEFDDPRIKVLDLSWRHRIGIGIFGRSRLSGIHWLMMIAGVEAANTTFALLHDADAFFIDADALERQYKEASENNLLSCGIEARWDPFFDSSKKTIPGTWELMFSTKWIRSRSALYAMPGTFTTSGGEYGFDFMLYPQFLDVDTGRVRVMSNPPRIVHFNGTILSYRAFRNAHGKPVTDELFRVLLLSLIESALKVPGDRAVCPPVEDLAAGLTNPKAPVLYQSEINRRGYAEFRGMLERLFESPTFQEERAERIREGVKVFDQHFQWDHSAPVSAALSHGEHRRAPIS